ncbi:heavy metal transport/detoxification protein [Marispirochaeta aestuarii]|uniref:Heavy metal transport/detoxification protein n=1 Tax=Marispirochaeta aestuarii TaxID=1963862 RepID=A0A1Y1S345_9SPIO|nr:heavy-metal-associated domain-containing protein [Marispirochaeta aestuarii]ORC38389.1 heavy metal transport/detoxification protein [Marispirochaeta aestuarii]
MKTLLRSDQLSCPSCVAKIEKSLMSNKGVHFAKVYFNTGKIEVEHDDELTSQDDIVRAVRQAGYSAKVSKV